MRRLLKLNDTKKKSFMDKLLSDIVVLRKKVTTQKKFKLLETKRKDVRENLI